MPAKRKRPAPTLPNPAHFAGDQMAVEPAEMTHAPQQQQLVVTVPTVPWWVWVGFGVAIGYGAPKAFGKVRTMVGG